MAARLSPASEFVAFLGDEVIGLTRDLTVLRNQRRTWLDQEMSWLDRSRIPLYHVASNHTTYNEASEQLFREVLPHLPRNGSPGQEVLTYYVRHANLLLVFINEQLRSRRRRMDRDRMAGADPHLRCGHGACPGVARVVRTDFPMG